MTDDDLPELIRTPPGLYRHYKGMLYEVIDTVRHSETLEPMNPADRRLVHQYIEKQKELKTVTVGNGQNKRVVIMPQSEEVPPQDAPRPRRSRRGGRSRSKQRDQSS